MKAKSCMMMAVAAGAACSAFATEPQIETANQVVLKGHIYVNARTGERTVNPINSNNRMGAPVWQNEDSASNGNFFWGMDNPTATFPTSVGGGQRIGGEASNWGDLEFDTFIDGYTTAYATAVFDGTSSIAGFSIINWWFDCDDGFNDISAIPVWGIGLSSIAGGDPTLGSTLFAGWIYTVDLAGTGFEFEMGDTDGTFTGLAGLSSTGCDKDDSDGSPENDFSYSYIFVQNQAAPLATTGPFLVLPALACNFEDDGIATGATGNAQGDDDAFDFWKAPNGFLRELYAATFWFGGWPAAPYAAFWMGMYGGSGGGCPDFALADYDGDTEVGILDFLAFLDDFGTCENQPTPCTATGFDADIYNPDGFIDILDFLTFFDLFGQCEGA